MFEEEFNNHIFCSICSESLMPINSPMCGICGIPFDCVGPDHLCKECMIDPPPFLSARAVYRYGVAARDAVLRLKYEKISWIGKKLGTLISKTFLLDNLTDVIVPVPLHKNKLYLRGFNQSALLAKQVSKLFSCPISVSAIERIVDTPPQAGRNKRERLVNLNGAFQCSDEKQIKKKHVLLIDDVITTGATAAAVTTTLLRAGAASVRVAAFARTC